MDGQSSIAKGSSESFVQHGFNALRKLSFKPAGVVTGSIPQQRSAAAALSIAKESKSLSNLGILDFPKCQPYDAGLEIPVHKATHAGREEFQSGSNNAPLKRSNCACQTVVSARFGK